MPPRLLLLSALVAILPYPPRAETNVATRRNGWNGRLLRPILLAFGCASTLLAGAAEVVRYEDFGAVGDGKADDHPAIIRAHEHANQRGLKVRAKDGATYYIGGTDNATAIIQTDVDFGTARFIIDDTSVTDRTQSVFQVTSLLEPFAIEGVASLKRNQADLGVKLPQASMVEVQNEKVKHYVRRGANQHSGVPQRDIFIADADGRIDPATAIIWDFDELTELTAYPIDERQLRITGGHFTTIANKAPPKYDYFSRNFSIQRSNVLIDGIEHHVTGEGNSGAPYSGWLNIGHSANVTVRNAVLSAHKTYSTKLKNFRKKMGTYGLSVGRGLNVSFINCRQSNDIDDESRWGLMVSNGSKNITFDGCTFNRFDAHQGIANATIRNSTIGHAGIQLMGVGTLLLENTTVRKNYLVSLREDYGSSWRGDIIIRNCVLQPTKVGKEICLLAGKNNGQHNYGHPSQMPETITIEGLKIEDKEHPDDYQGSFVLGNFNPGYKDASFVEIVPYAKPRKITTKHVTVSSGKSLGLSQNPVMFRDVQVEGIANP
jgi:hypothetical protein